MLKKLCAHVKKQREQGISQAQIANGLLNVDQLFREDLLGLGPEEESSLRRIAKLSPVVIGDIGDEISPNILQSLIDRRLVVRIGTKLDIYWDIFRDYLNTGKIPAQEQYLPRLGTRSVYKACRALIERNRQLALSQLPATLKVSAQSTYNVLHELRMLGLVKQEDDKIILTLSATEPKDLPRAFSQQVAEKLRKNRLAHYVVDALKVSQHLSLAQAATLLKEKCPYISASQSTWEAYADIFCDWLEAGGLIRYNQRAKALSSFVAGQDIREVTFSSVRRRGGVQALQIHFSPVHTLVLAFIEFAKTKTIDWPQMRPSTREKCLILLEDFGFIVRSDGQLRLSKEFARFLDSTTSPRDILAEAVKKISSFAAFLQILESHKSTKCPVLVLGRELRDKFETDWTDGTALTTAKICLDWARHTGLAPGVFAKSQRTKPSNAFGADLAAFLNQDLSKVDTSDTNEG